MKEVWFLTGVLLCVYIFKVFILKEEKNFGFLAGVYAVWIIENLIMASLGSSERPSIFASAEQFYPFENNIIAAYNSSELLGYILIPLAFVFAWSSLTSSSK